MNAFLASKQEEINEMKDRADTMKTLTGGNEEL
jgi:hypothetical protein